MDKFILSKINKKLEIVLEAADSDTRNYELDYRIPKMKEVIQRGDLVISTWRLLWTEYRKKNLGWFYEENKDKIALADDILGIIDVPNTLALLIYCVAVCNPKKIILFGVDGYKGKNDESEYTTYYKSEEAKIRRARQLQHRKNFTLKETSDNFDTWFGIGLYCSYMNCNTENIPKIINCSPNSQFDSIRKINYNELKKEL